MFLSRPITFLRIHRISAERLLLPLVLLPVLMAGFGWVVWHPCWWSLIGFMGIAIGFFFSQPRYVWFQIPSMFFLALTGGFFINCLLIFRHVVLQVFAKTPQCLTLFFPHCFFIATATILGFFAIMPIIIMIDDGERPISFKPLALSAHETLRLRIRNASNP